MSQSENGTPSPAPEAPSSGSTARATAGGRLLNVLYLVVAWRTIAALAAVAALTALVLGIANWPFWDYLPREVVVTRPAPEVPAADLDSGRQELDRLTRQIADLETQIASKRAACEVIDPPPPPPPPREDPPAQEEAQLDCETTCRLCRENKRELTGNVSISLDWNSYADLDLHLQCPDGSAIKHDKLLACGGELNVDMNNQKNSSATPIENITLTEQSPTGRYRILVHFYKNVPGELTVPYRVSLVLRGQTQNFTGIAAFPLNNSEMILVHEFDIEPPQSQAPDQAASFQLKCTECNCAQGDAATGTQPAQSTPPPQPAQ